MIVKPEDFPLSEVYKRIMENVEGEAGTEPVAFILPSTRESIATAMRLGNEGGVRVIGGLGLTGMTSPADLLALIREESVRRQPLVVFTDQILSSADASILVRTDESNIFCSPIEAILNIKYDYRLEIWTISGYITVEAHAPSLEAVFECIVLHLQSCKAYGAGWEMRGMQNLRTYNVRRHNAMRKLRFFRSAVINAYCESPWHPAAILLLNQINNLERQVVTQDSL